MSNCKGETYHGKIPRNDCGISIKGDFATGEDKGEESCFGETFRVTWRAVKRGGERRRVVGGGGGGKK